MKIEIVKQVSPGVFKLTPDGEPVFFLRTSYLRFVSADSFFAGAVFTQEQKEDIESAARIFAVEQAAMQLLSRAEQCRKGLYIKLLKKGFAEADINEALDYLEAESLLDDRRFASAWLCNRAISHAEGCIRLTAELAARGIDHAVVKSALAEYYHDCDEEEICCRALMKYRRQNRPEEKLAAFLVRQGFSGKIIKKVFDQKVH